MSRNMLRAWGELDARRQQEGGTHKVGSVALFVFVERTRAIGLSSRHLGVCTSDEEGEKTWKEARSARELRCWQPMFQSGRPATSQASGSSGAALELPLKRHRDQAEHSGSSTRSLGQRIAWHERLNNCGEQARVRQRRASCSRATQKSDPSASPIAAFSRGRSIT